MAADKTRPDKKQKTNEETSVVRIYDICSNICIIAHFLIRKFSKLKLKHDADNFLGSFPRILKKVTNKIFKLSKKFPYRSRANLWNLQLFLRSIDSDRIKEEVLNDARVAD